jgi:dTDP-4-amino-4,6-dideoxygalactose transaminase
MMVPFNKPFIVGKELYYISQAVIEGQLSADGAFSRKCHDWLEKHLGCRRAFLTPSCTSALEMAAILCDLLPGDEVIMPSFTYAATANAFVRQGARPVFIDIRPDTLNLDENLIEDALTPKTRALVPVHYAGAACAMDRIGSIASAHELTIIEDAAQSLLSTYKSRCLGTIGHLGCLSFHETKNLNCGEGGALLVNDPRFLARAEIIRENGTNRSAFFRGEVGRYTWVDIGSSFLPSELAGAFLYAQLEMAEDIIAARNRIYDTYVQRLKGLEQKGCIRLPSPDPDSRVNGHILYVITGSLAERTRLAAYLRDRDMLAVFHYIPLHSSPAGRKYGRIASRMAVTDTISDTLLRLPLYFGMRDEDIHRVADAIEAFYAA